MKLYQLSLGLLMIAAVSCRKDPKIENVIEEEPDTFELVNTPGSWWKYNWYDIDSLGNETLLAEKDCVYVVGDTLINGKSYIHYTGDYYIYSSYDWFWRDSANFIVNSVGNKLFSTIEQLDTLEKNIGAIESNFVISNGLKAQKIVDAGSFLVFESQTHYIWTDGTPFTACDEVWIKHTYFSTQVGVVSMQTGYISAIQQLCQYQESRLSEFYISP